ncbi:MAG: GntR family transcriptional regulator [Pseudomonadota bacterium]
MADRKTQSLEDLQQQILSLSLPPGSDLDEASLCDTYGMSRTPLREVLQRLAGDGFVTLTQNRGAKVVPMDLPTMRTFFQTAPMVYANIARLAASNRTDSQVHDLKRIQLRFRTATDHCDAAKSAMVNHAFHGKIGQMADNPYLKPALDRMLIDHTRMSQTFYRPSNDADIRRVQTACDQHDQMIVAFESRNPDLAADLTLKHWDLSRDQMERFVRPDPLPIDMPEIANAV